jgi:competence protein ComEC
MLSATGTRGRISETTNDDLRASGLYHIVSISGLHMVLAAGVLFWSLRGLLAAFPAIALRHPIKKYAAFGAMLGAITYCVFSGAEVATVRSLVMTLVMLGAVLFDRPALAMRNLAISAILVLVAEPEALLGPSFQMSFAAVGCLIAANRVWQDWKATRREPRYGPARRAVPRGSTRPGGRHPPRGAPARERPAPARLAPGSATAISARLLRLSRTSARLRPAISLL